MFVDEAIIHCVAGRGGNGCNSFDRSKPGHPRPHGGHGGHGGSLIIESRLNIQTLYDFQLNPYFSAQNGTHGSSNHKNGAHGVDRIIGVPVGTEVIDNKNGELLKDLVEAGACVIVAKGGQGGHGNHKKDAAGDGGLGESKEILLRLKLIADIGLIGFPNAGKSTFLSRVTSAKSKSAAYPFTTKNPVLGVVQFYDTKSAVIADIPGIIEGAHTGRGLGLEFLKHIERTRLLVHLIDFACVDGRDPVSDYWALSKELESYSARLSEKPQVVVANKMDVPEARKQLDFFRKKIKKKVYPISAVSGDGVRALLKALEKMV